jgi:endonuclease G
MKYLLLIIISIICSTSYSADNSLCSKNLYNSKFPILTNDKLNIITLCYDQFTILYSPVSKTPIISSQYLTKQDIIDSSNYPRINNFHEEINLPVNYRSHVEDYYKTGYDRGHLTPNRDMPDIKSKDDSFILTNIAPQSPGLNRGKWAQLENNVRKDILSSYNKYIVTGVLFNKPTVKSLNGVLVPDYFYKIVFDGSNTKVYIAENVDDSEINLISLSELETMTGIHYE